MNSKLLLLLVLTIISVSVESLLRSSVSYRVLTLKRFNKIKLAVGKDEDSEFEAMKLDQSKLDPKEKERLDFIQKLSLEADEMVRAAGFSIDGEQDEDEIELAIKDTQWSGQSDVEEVNLSKSNLNDITSRPLLFAGDVLALVVFALIGRNSHNEGMDLVAVFATAAPFVLSWTAVSSFVGGYTRTATASQVRAATILLSIYRYVSLLKPRS